MQKVLIAMGVLIAVLIVVGLSLPRQARVVATLEIDARPATVYALVNDFSRVALWSPWLERDPNARVDISDPARGVGASMEWDGLVLGTGSQRIAASEPFEFVATEINPGEAPYALSRFDLQDTGSTTVVSWSFEADYGYNLVGRYTWLLLRGVIRRDYEYGLRNLAALAESLPRVDFGDLDVEWLEVESQDIAYRSTSSQRDPEAMAAAMGTAYFEVLKFIDANDLQDVGAPQSIIRTSDGRQMRFDAAIPVGSISDDTPREADGVRLGQTYAGRVIRVVHQGSYRDLSQTQRKIAAYLAAYGIDRNGDFWESYVDDPTTVPESEIRTEIYYPVR